MVYAVWLFGLSTLFFLAERCWPERRQRIFRKGFLQDLWYLIFHGEYLGVLLGVLSVQAITALDASLDVAGMKPFMLAGFSL